MALPTPDTTRANSEILSEAALEFLTTLHGTFDGARKDLLARRRKRQQAFNEGADPGFLAAIQSVRGGDWRVAPAPADLNDRRVEIISPPKPR